MLWLKPLKWLKESDSSCNLVVNREDINKSELNKNLAIQCPSLSKKKVKNAVGEILEYITSALVQGGRIEIRGFGNFSSRYHISNLFFNPKNGKRVKINRRYITHFKPVKKLRNQINLPVVRE